MTENGQVCYCDKYGKFHNYSQWKDNVGYYQVKFTRNKKSKYIRVHRLVAETFLPNPNNYPQVNHIDGNKTNNKADNLEWITNQKNTLHGYESNLYKSKRRCCPIRTINKTTEEVLNFKSIRECANILHLNRKTITSILKNDKINNYNYIFQYIETQTTIGDECNQVE